MNTRPMNMDTASPARPAHISSVQQKHASITDRLCAKKKRRHEFLLLTCRTEDDLDRERHAVRIHEVVQQRARRERGDLEQPLRDRHLARFEPRESEPPRSTANATAADADVVVGRRRVIVVPGYEGG